MAVADARLSTTPEARTTTGTAGPVVAVRNLRAYYQVSQYGVRREVRASTM